MISRKLQHQRQQLKQQEKQKLRQKEKKRQMEKLQQQQRQEQSQFQPHPLDFTQKYDRNQSNSPVAKIVIKDKQIQDACVLISSDYVLTARHNLFENQYYQNQSNPYVDQNGNKKNWLVPIKQVIIKFYIINQKIQQFYIQKIIELYDDKQTQKLEAQESYYKFATFAAQDIILLKLSKRNLDITPIQVYSPYEKESSISIIKCQQFKNQSNQTCLRQSETKCTSKEFKSDLIVLSALNENEKLVTQKGDSGSPIIQFIKNQNQWKCVGIYLLKKDQNYIDQKICLTFTHQLIQRIKKYTTSSQQNLYPYLYEKQFKMFKLNEDNTQKQRLNQGSISFERDEISCINFFQNPNIYDKLNQLRQLNLSRNKISQIPNLANYYPNLKQLDIKQNNIQFYGSSNNQCNFQNINWIQIVNISDNPQLQILKKRAFPSQNGLFKVKKLILKGNSFMNFIFNLSFLQVITQNQQNQLKPKQNINNNTTTNQETTNQETNNDSFISNGQNQQTVRNKKKIMQFSIKLNDYQSFKQQNAQQSFRQFFVIPLKKLQQKLLKQQNQQDYQIKQIKQNLKDWKIYIEFIDKDSFPFRIDLKQNNEEQFELFDIIHVQSEKYQLKYG